MFLYNKMSSNDITMNDSSIDDVLNMLQDLDIDDDDDMDIVYSILNSKFEDVLDMLQSLDLNDDKMDIAADFVQMDLVDEQDKVKHVLKLLKRLTIEDTDDVLMTDTDDDELRNIQSLIRDINPLQVSGLLSIFDDRLELANKNGDTQKYNVIKQKKNDFVTIVKSIQSNSMSPNQSIPVSDEFKQILYGINVLPQCPDVKIWRGCQQSSMTSSLISYFSGATGLLSVTSANAKKVLVDTFGIGVWLDGYGVTLNGSSNITGQSTIPLINKITPLLSLKNTGEINAVTNMFYKEFISANGYRGSKITYNTKKVIVYLTPDNGSLGQFILGDKDTVGYLKKLSKVVPTDPRSIWTGVCDNKNSRSLNIIPSDAPGGMVRKELDIDIYVWGNCFELFTTILNEEYAILPPDCDGDVIFVPTRISSIQQDHTMTRWPLKLGPNNDNSKPFFTLKMLPVGNQMDTFEISDAKGLFVLFREEFIKINKTYEKYKDRPNLLGNSFYLNDIDRTDIDIRKENQVILFNNTECMECGNVYIRKKFIDKILPEYQTIVRRSGEVDEAQVQRQMSDKNISLYKSAVNNLHTRLLVLVFTMYNALIGIDDIYKRIPYINRTITFIFKTISIFNNNIRGWFKSTGAQFGLVSDKTSKSECLDPFIRSITPVLDAMNNVQKNCNMKNKDKCYGDIRDIIPLFNSIDSFLEKLNNLLQCGDTNTWRSIGDGYVIMTNLKTLNDRTQLCNRLRRIIRLCSKVIPNVNDAKLELQYYNNTPMFTQKLENENNDEVHYLNDLTILLVELLNKENLKLLLDLKINLKPILTQLIWTLEWNFNKIPKFPLTLMDTPLFEHAIDILDIKIQTSDDGIVLNPQFK